MSLPAYTSISADPPTAGKQATGASRPSKKTGGQATGVVDCLFKWINGIKNIGVMDYWNGGVMDPSTFLPSLRWTSVGLLVKWKNGKSVRFFGDDYF